jgi:hypothetical protein
MSSKLALSRSNLLGLDMGSQAFIAMIADLQPLHNNTKLSKYADDLTAVTSSSLTSHGNEEIEHVKLWALNNKLLLNTSKSKEMCGQGNSGTVD